MYLSDSHLKYMHMHGITTQQNLCVGTAVVHCPAALDRRDVNNWQQFLKHVKYLYPKYKVVKMF